MSRSLERFPKTREQGEHRSTELFSFTIHVEGMKGNKREMERARIYTNLVNSLGRLFEPKKESNVSSSWDVRVCDDVNVS